MVSVQANEKLDAAQRLVQQRELDCQSYREQIAQLRQEIEQLSNPVPEVQQFRLDQLEFLEEQNSQLLEEVGELQRRYLTASSKKRTLRARLKIAIESQQYEDARPGSDVEAETAALRQKVINLESNVKTLTSRVKLSEANLNKAQSQAAELKAKNKKLRDEAKTKFEILQTKLIQSRNGQLDEELQQMQAEKADLEDAISQLEKASQDLTAEHMGFVQKLGRLVGADDAIGVVSRVKDLILLPVQIENLKLEMIELQNRRSGNQNVAYDATVEALKQVRGHLSPDYLRLADNSVLRQLFASFHNLVTAMLHPIESKAILGPM
jgi:chromosome segregation ATPase